jgi:hypothetical protein
MPGMWEVEGLKGAVASSLRPYNSSAVLPQLFALQASFNLIYRSQKSASATKSAGKRGKSHGKS